MNREQRKSWLAIANFPEEGFGLCNLCKYAEWDGSSCCEAYLECKHPLDAVNGFYDDSEHANAVWGEGADCWGFRPNCTLQEAGIKASIRAMGGIPHKNKHGEWVALMFPKEQLEAIF